MGFLTTITIYNDGADSIQKHSKEFAEKVFNACNGVQRRKGVNYDSLGPNANLLILQKPRHSSDITLYLHAGNTLIDVFDAKTPWAIDSFIAEMKFQIKRLEEIKHNNQK